MKLNHCLLGDCRDSMRLMIDQGGGSTVQTIITSPPYWGLRDYGVAGQIGLEPTLQEFIATMVEVFSLARDLLADDGTLWLNMGDAYAGSWGAQGRPQGDGQMTGRSVASARQIGASPRFGSGTGTRGRELGLKSKDLMGQPWRLAFALQDAGWYLRQDIIWHKPNPMPESVTDRCTKSHEYLFLLTKSQRYYFDQDAIKEPASYNTHERVSRAAMDHKSAPSDMKNGIRPRSAYKTPDGWDTTKGEGGHGSFHKEGREAGRKLYPGTGVGFGRGTDAEKRGRGRVKNNESFDAAMAIMPDTRNKRSVWTIPTQAYPEAHFATFPQALVEPCILAGSKPGDIVFDPFMGSGTVAEVAQNLGRSWVGCELNSAYIELQHQRTRQAGLVLEVA